ncbi:hypothetical protein SAMN05443668_107163 [Cryptosporangium aurantiacum]|uniref:2-hydroxyacyl-CoA dehydratase n=1 Tax=Cryptosporangium aurantiacum TaxID=134849 RepID=A0A1M7TW58_9ACTN|nr:hypothetical protein SAMN05443668_107163 [Cryptosporangium aurantiacum]
MVGVVGGDVPVELITAAGAVPVRLSGSPDVDRELGDRYLGTGVDPEARALLAGLLAGAWPGLDALVVGRDCEASSRLFYALRELHRTGAAPGLPPVLLADVLHLPHRSTTRYVAHRLGELRTRLADVLGTARPGPADAAPADTAPADGVLADAALAEAVRAHDLLRARLATLVRRRRAMPMRSGPPELSGVDALALYAATETMPVADGIALLDRTLVGPPDAAAVPRAVGALESRGQADGARRRVPLRRVPLRRVHLTGSSHDGPSVYLALENAGYVVVSDDHDRGDLLARGQVGDPANLAEFYQSARPTAARSAPRVRAALLDADLTESVPDLVVAYIREHDDAPSWDLAAQRAVCARRGVPLVVVDRQQYGQIDLERLEQV